MINEKDKLVIWLLILLLIFSTFTSCLMTSEVDSLKNAVEAIANGQKIQQTEQNEMSATFTASLTDIEDKLVDIDERLNNIETKNKEQDEILSDHEDLFEDHSEKIAEIQKNRSSAASKPKITTGVKVSLTESEIRMIAALVYLECGSKSYKCQMAVASVIVNRMSRYHMTARQVVYQDGVFSPAYKVSRTKPSASCIRAVRQVVRKGSILPKKVVAFRNRHYHAFGKRYCVIDGVYFTAI